jgi:hypothetical protein
MLAWKDRVEAPNQYFVERAQEWLVGMYVAWGKPEKAAEWRKKQNR